MTLNARPFHLNVHRRRARAIAPSLTVITVLMIQVAHSWSAHAAERLSEAAIAQRQSTIPDWTVVGQVLSCTYEFENFVESVEFVNQLVEPAETLRHHPDLTISYNEVSINLTTHDAGGLTALDFDLAESISELSDRLCQP